MATAFRYKRGANVSYEDQGYIYFLSQRYRMLNAEKKNMIRQACRDAAGSAQKAVLEYVTTECDSRFICDKHALSESTLERMVRRYYRIMAERI